MNYFILVRDLCGLIHKSHGPMNLFFEILFFKNIYKENLFNKIELKEIFNIDTINIKTLLS